MMMQPRQYRIADYSSSFLWGVSTWYFLSNSTMWPFLIIVPDIFIQDIFDYSVSLKKINLSKASLLSELIDRALKCIHVGSIR